MPGGPDSLHNALHTKGRIVNLDSYHHRKLQRTIGIIARRFAVKLLAKLKENMRTYIEKRLENLIGEHANGQTAIRNLEAQLTAMRETVTRINGAITLCQEALRDAPKEEPQTVPPKLVAVHPGTECGADLAARREYTPGARKAYESFPSGSDDLDPRS